MSSFYVWFVHGCYSNGVVVSSCLLLQQQWYTHDRRTLFNLLAFTGIHDRTLAIHHRSHAGTGLYRTEAKIIHGLYCRHDVQQCSSHWNFRYTPSPWPWTVNVCLLKLTTFCYLTGHQGWFLYLSGLWNNVWIRARVTDLLDSNEVEWRRQALQNAGNLNSNARNNVRKEVGLFWPDPFDAKDS